MVYSTYQLSVGHIIYSTYIVVQPEENNKKKKKNNLLNTYNLDLQNTCTPRFIHAHLQYTCTLPNYMDTYNLDLHYYVHLP